jgi:small-conductance mechanosensitive channel
VADLLQNLQSNLDTISRALSFAPAWAVAVFLFAGAAVFAWLLHNAVNVALHRLLTRSARPYLNSVLDATRKPAGFGLLLIAIAIVLPAAPLELDARVLLLRLLVLATICLLGWSALTALNIAANLYLMRFRIDVEDNLLARKHLTQVRVLTRVLDTVVVLVTIGLALMTFDSVRQYGVSLFASAGVAGIIAGLAARPVLSNLLAGVQLAVTQPIRLEDAVTVENEYGWIEEITSTYVVIRLWDLRRLVVPLTYFIEKPFYNWTRQAARNIGSVLLYLDYSAPIDVIRAKAAEIAAEWQQPDAGIVNVQVTNTTADAIEVRVLVRANSAATGDLCADLREKLIAFLQREHPQVLPRRRNEIIEPPVRKGPRPAPAPGA